MEFTIYRKSWRRGGNSVAMVGDVEQHGDTSLLNAHNMFCCLGMCSIELGVRPSDIFEEDEPGLIDEALIPKKTILWNKEGVNSALSKIAIEINDDPTLQEKEREARLTKLFASRGHTLSFVNKLAPKSWRVAQ